MESKIENQKSKINIAVLVSGDGSNFEAIACAVKNGAIPQAEVKLMVANKPGVGSLDRAQRLGIESMVLQAKDFPDRSAYFARMNEEFKKRDIRLVCLAGFLIKVEPSLLISFPGRILNIHPALLPKYGGQGMYGRYVHEAVIKAGEKESGCTVHLIDDEYDKGRIVKQARVPVLPDDTPDTLAARVLEQEHKLYPEVVRQMVSFLLSQK